MEKKGFALIEILVVMLIISILSSIGVVSYNNYTSTAKDSATKLNYNKIVKTMESEFAHCKLDNDSKIFNSHKCNSSQNPSLNTLNDYFNNILKLKNPYDNKQQVAQSNICNKGSVSITNKATGSYEVKYASIKKKEKYTSTVSSHWSSNYTQTISTKASFTCASSGGSQSAAKYKWEKTNEHKARKIDDPSGFDWDGNISGSSYGTNSRTIIRQGGKKYFAAELGITDYAIASRSWKKCKNNYQKIKDGTLTNKIKRWGYPGQKNTMYPGGKGTPYARDSLSNGRC